MVRASSSLAAGFILAILAACSPDARSPVAPRLSRAPRLQSDVAGCDTVAIVGVNDWYLPLRPGFVPLAPGIIDGQVLFQGTQVIFGGGLLYATSAGDIVAGYRTNTGTSDLGQGPICVDQTAPFMHTVATATVDSGIVGPAGLAVTQESFAWPDAPDNGYVLLKYTFTNTGHAIINHLYSGWLNDWDLLFDGGPFSDVLQYDARLGLGEASESDTLDFPAILGVVPVGPSGLGSFAGYLGGTDRLTPADYFGLLSGGINAGTTGPGDIREEIGLAPVTLLPKHSTVVYFAIVGGADRAQWEANVAAARAKANQLGFCGAPGLSASRGAPTILCN